MAIKIYIDQGHNPEGINAGAEGFGIVIRMLVMTVGVFLITWIIIVILSKIPYLKEISGYH